MENNIDEDIKIVEETIKCLKETMEYEDIYKTEVSHVVIPKRDVKAFENVLSELETYKKIADKIEKYARGIDDKELLLIIHEKQIDDLFDKFKKEGLVS